MDSATEDRSFSAKLLLFGEHVLLLGAPALAVPVAAFAGHWHWSEQRDRHHARLRQFAESEVLSSIQTLDNKQFVRDLEAGLCFQSNIPTGYGLGSSGALCAAIYDRYALEKTTDLAALKRTFAQMEGFFHGNSSGIDPLTSYLDAAILIRNQTEVQGVIAHDWADEKPFVFLLDSKLPRRTGPLVAWFLEQHQQPNFAAKLASEYLPAHEASLEAWIAGDSERFWPNLQRVSNFQLENFKPMIPRTVEDFWRQNQNNPALILKICGAGGGGFVLGFARNADLVTEIARQFELVYPMPTLAQTP